eukprot:TRINITY_DN21124_c0_g1_i1.p2 TRINITY_DN21124_c0_g1~~TRINITY_DN21124_c0_g1_i1.p2  ORF type:complete len:155 (+),score=23.43 TRINITY_DN21124_c0_g1_i1:59-523(+)
MVNSPLPSREDPFKMPADGPAGLVVPDDFPGAVQGGFSDRNGFEAGVHQPPMPLMICFRPLRPMHPLTSNQVEYPVAEAFLLHQPSGLAFSGHYACHKLEEAVPAGNSFSEPGHQEGSIGSQTPVSHDEYSRLHAANPFQDGPPRIGQHHTVIQ